MSSKAKAKSPQKIPPITEEQKRKEAEENAIRRKDKELFEAKATKLNSLKVETKWRTQMRKDKAQDIITQLAFTHQLHERHAASAINQLNQMELSIQEAEQQWKTALANHSQNLDSLSDLHIQRINSWNDKFNEQLGTLQNDFSTERVQQQVKHLQERADLLGILTRLENKNSEMDTDTKHDLQSVRDDVKNKDSEEKHALKIQLEGTIDELWKQYQSALQNYNTTTEDRRVQYESLTQREKENSSTLEQQMKRLTKLQDNISQLRSRIQANSISSGPRNETLRITKEMLSAHFQSLKKRLLTVREAEKQRLKELSVRSGNVIKTLQERVGLAEKIIKTAELNAALETEGEKIREYYTETQEEDMAEETQAVLARMQRQSADKASTEVIPRGNSSKNQLKITDEETQVLDKFNKKYNKAYLETLALQSERAELEEENATLKDLLKQYLEGISVSENVLAKDNTLFVVNGKTNAPMPAPGTVRNLGTNYVEAAHAVQSQRRRI